MSSFAERVYAETRKIPRGSVATYGDIARAVGAPGASRAVGTALGNNPDTDKTPCHRVVRANGEVGGYAFGPKEKIRLLEREGIPISDGVVDASAILRAER